LGVPSHKTGAASDNLFNTELISKEYNGFTINKISELPIFIQVD
jgi:hypothetical protein